MRVALEGLPGAVMWTDEIAREDAARAVDRTVPADATAPVRVYVVAPEGTAEQAFAFTVTSLDRQGEMDTSEATFSAPGGQP